MFINLLILIDYFLCSTYPCVLFESSSNVINQKSHVYSWNLGKFTSFIFSNFEISLVSLRKFQNFKKLNSVNLSQIPLLNMWLLVQITPNAFSFVEMFIPSWLMYSIDTRITITVIMTYTSYYWKSVSFSILCHWWQHKETSQLICTGKWLVYWF